MSHINIIPLHDDIEKKFGQFMTIYRINEGRFYLYKYLNPYDDGGGGGTASYDPEPFLCYDETDGYYRFNCKKYSKAEFIKIINLLVFI
jgi:hypothetical protein